jgi:hypothetical protein
MSWGSCGVDRVRPARAQARPRRRRCSRAARASALVRRFVFDPQRPCCHPDSGPCRAEAGHASTSGIASSPTSSRGGDLEPGVHKHAGQCVLRRIWQCRRSRARRARLCRRGSQARYLEEDLQRETSSRSPTGHPALGVPPSARRKARAKGGVLGARVHRRHFVSVVLDAGLSMSAEVRRAGLLSRVGSTVENCREQRESERRTRYEDRP